MREILNDVQLTRIKKNVPALLNSGEINKNKDNKRFAQFYLGNSLISLRTAMILNEISSNNEIKKQFKYLNSEFESYLWVINSSYYSMFYMAGALLASEGLKIKSTMGVHKKTFDCFAYYFYLTEKIAKKYVEEYKTAQNECQQLLGTDEILIEMQKKSKELLDNYDSEMEKRSRFTYEMGVSAKSSKASTSLNRAIKFYNECQKILNS